MIDHTFLIELDITDVRFASFKLYLLKYLLK